MPKPSKKTLWKMNTKTNTSELLLEKTFTLEELNKFPTVNAMLDAKYGREGTPTRDTFEREAKAYCQKYYCGSGGGKKEQTETVKRKRTGFRGKINRLGSLLNGYKKHS